MKPLPGIEQTRPCIADCNKSPSRASPVCSVPIDTGLTTGWRRCVVIQEPRSYRPKVARSLPGERDRARERDERAFLVTLVQHTRPQFDT
jgi:hypothetical protein